MTTFRQKLHTQASIPCFLALVALFGCSLVSLPKAALKKSAQINGGNVTHLVDEGIPQTGPDRLAFVLSNGSTDGLYSSELSLEQISIDPSRGRMELTRRVGDVQGRAPPFDLSC